MPRTYQPTETDSLTGANLKTLRKKRGIRAEDLVTPEHADLGFSASKYGYIERGLALLDDPTAAKLAAYYGVGVSQIIVKSPQHQLVGRADAPKTGKAVFPIEFGSRQSLGGGFYSHEPAKPDLSEVDVDEQAIDRVAKKLADFDGHDWGAIGIVRKIRYRLRAVSLVEALTDQEG